jgi:archaellum biogenesis ATPase FlaH
MSKDYSIDLQKLYLELLVQDPDSFTKVLPIFNKENFHRSLQEPAMFMSDYVLEYGALPSIEQINATTGSNLEDIKEFVESQREWLLNEFEEFSRHKTIERAIYDAPDMLEKGEYLQVETRIKEAVQISLMRDLGLDYFDDPRARLNKLRDNNGQVSTGWPTLDRKLYGGVNRGELSIFLGGSGSGKSLFLQNMAVNWMLLGLNVCFMTLELNQELTALRIDSMVSCIPTKEIFKKMSDLELKVALVGKTSGRLRIKYLPAGSNINDFRSYMKEVQAQTGKKADILIIDYMDLCQPVSVKVNASDTFTKDKYVAEEIRNLAGEMQVAAVSASQLNRGAVDELEYDHSHTAGGISKIYTCDNAFGIFTSEDMKKKGRYQLQLMKTRSSGGVGSKIDLAFNVDTLRITDPEFEENQEPTKPSIADSIKRNASGILTEGNLAEGEEVQKIKGVQMQKTPRNALEKFRANNPIDSDT